MLLQVAIVCCPHYHLREQQIFELQKVEIASTLCNMKICCAEVVIRATFLQTIATCNATLLRDKLQKKVARITWPLISDNNRSARAF